MRTTPFAHMGGAVIADHGPLGLGEARALTAFYAAEALEAGEGPWRKVCARRARTLHAASEDAERWRRAAGWADPEAADG